MPRRAARDNLGIARRSTSAGFRVLSQRWRVAAVILPTAALLAGTLADASAAASTTARPRVVATVEVPNGDLALETNPRTGKLYVGNQGQPTISVVDERTLRVTQTLHGGDCCGVYNLAADLANGSLFASGIDDDTYIINGLTHKSTGLGFDSYGAAYDSANDTTYLQAVYTNEVAVVRHGALRPTGFMHIGTDPNGQIGQIAVNPVTNNLYMTYSSYAGVSGLVVVNAGTNHRSFVPVKGAAQVAVDAQTNRIYVVSINFAVGAYTSTLTVFDGATMKAIAHLRFGSTFMGLTVVNPVTHTVFILNFGDQTGGSNPGGLTVINGSTNKVVETIPLPNGLAGGLAFDPNTEDVFVSSDNSVTVVR